VEAEGGEGVEDGGAGGDGDLAFGSGSAHEDCDFGLWGHGGGWRVEDEG
jgi:hypothetical protein